jgi:hypothetical protein
MEAVAYACHISVSHFKAYSDSSAMAGGLLVLGLDLAVLPPEKHHASEFLLVRQCAPSFRLERQP